MNIIKTLWKWFMTFILCSFWISCCDICGKLKTIFTKKQKKQQDEAEDSWSKKLPEDVMQLILHRLPRWSDRIQCRYVCPSWRAAVDSKDDDPQVVPWLLLDSQDSFYLKADCFVSDWKIRKSKLDHTIRRMCCVGSIEGWLIMYGVSDTGRKKNFFFLNPVSGARVMLPTDSRWDVLSEKAVASSVPMTTKTIGLQQPCFVVTLVSLRTMVDPRVEFHLALSAPGDKSWTWIEAECLNEIREVEIYDGKLYAFTSISEFVMVFDIQLDSSGHGIHTYTAKRMITTHHPSLSLTALTCQHYILAKDYEAKELFMIFSIVREDTTEKIRRFQVFKLINNAISGPHWVHFTDLGDRALFLSYLSNKFISCNDDNMLEKNSIYFALDCHSHRNRPGHLILDSGVFSMTNQSIKPLTFPRDYLHGEKSRAVWFTPKPN